VIKGDGIGKTINFPTANLDLINRDKIIPSNGVYAIECEIENKFVKGVMNIGNRPTINNLTKTSIECHLFDWNEEVYNKILKVDVIKRIRNEIKFPDLNQLKKQIILDCEKAKKILNEK
jgi:riboflavin kinase/FMN adenylyltransferase